MVSSVTMGIRKMILSIMIAFLSPLANAYIREMKSVSMTSLSNMVDKSSDRHKRALFSIPDEQELVDQHNNLRKTRNSSDMEFMTRQSELTSMAEDWAKLCIWEHGQPFRSNPPFKDIGQNLYAYNGTFEPSRGLQLWWDEDKYYDYNTGACSKDPCGHYTQMAWSTSRTVGCAYAFCPTMEKIDLTNGHYLVCNYGPAGNWVGQKPYKKGKPCTECTSGQFWCDDGLCKESCPEQETKCDCKASCKNCGVTVFSNCSCQCPRGWTGVTCAEVCENKHRYCGANPGWPKYLCNTTSVRQLCPAMCDICQVQTDQPVTCVTTPTTPSVTYTTTTNNTGSSGSPLAISRYSLTIPLFALFWSSLR